MLFGTLSLNVLFYGIPRSNWFYPFVEQSHLPELTENFILDEPTRNKFLLHHGARFTLPHPPESM